MGCVTQFIKFVISLYTVNAETGIFNLPFILFLVNTHTFYRIICYLCITVISKYMIKLTLKFLSKLNVD